MATRAEIRRSVARMLSDLYMATDSTGGRTNAVVDTVAFARESGHFDGMQILFTNPSSPHYGTLATVTASDGPNRTVYFEPPLASASIAGETVELYNFRNRGTTVSQYNGAINDAISIARDQHALIPISYDVPDAFSRTSTVIDIPDTFAAFTGVRATRRDGRPYRVKPGSIYVDRMFRTVEVVAPAEIDYLHGLSLELVGYAKPELLNDDDDETTIDSEWLYNEVKAQVLERMVASGLPVSSQDRLYLQERNEAGGKRPIIVQRAAPGTVRLA